MVDASPDSSAQGAEEVRQRLTPLDRSAELLPWRRARELTRCSLYWMPVASYPVRGAQRAWLLTFLTRLTARLKSEDGLRPEQFLQYKTVYPELMQPLLNNMMELVPVLGLGRKPGASLPQFPNEQDIQRTTRKMFESLKKDEPVPLPDTRKHMPDYAYWFLDKSAQRQRDLFFGFGGLSLLFMKPDAKTAPPLLISPAQRAKMPLFQKMDVEKLWAQGQALNDPFLQQSKTLFGEGLENEPQTKGYPFILPLLDSADFFAQPEAIIKNVFELCDVYMRESPVDTGLVLAGDKDLDDVLIGLLRELSDENLMYPES